MHHYRSPYARTRLVEFSIFNKVELGVHTDRGRRGDINIKAIDAKAVGRFNGSTSSHREREPRSARKHRLAPRNAA